MPKKNRKKADKNDHSIVEEGLKDYMTIFSSRLTEAVKARGWSQVEFGKRVNTTQAMAGRYLHGQANPTLDLLARIERATQIPVPKFFEDGEPLPLPDPNLPMATITSKSKMAAETLALLKTISTNLEPAIAALKAGNESLPTDLKKVSRGKLRNFVDAFTDDSMTGYVYELMSANASPEKIRIEFVRELAVNLLAEGGDTAKEFREVITELLEKEAEMNRG